MQAKSTHTLEQTAILLGWSTHTVRTYADIAGIVPATGPHYRQRTLYSNADIELLRRTRAERDPQYLTVKASDSGDLAARVAALEATIERLQQRWPHLFAETRSNAPQLPAVELPAYEPPRRLAPSTVRHSHTPAHPQIPAGMMALPTWARLHGIAQGTVEHWRDVGKLPTVRGTWLEGKTRITYVLTAEGREIAHQLAQQLAQLPWPCEHCAAVEEDNETPHPSDE